MQFDALGLNEALLKAISDQGYQNPTPIQCEAIPSLLTGKDILATAQTGTGKTAAFTLPLLQRLSLTTPTLEKKQIRALVLVPTRELALQVDANIQKYATYLSIRSTVVFGGLGINPQLARIRKGVDIVIATPGRLLDIVSQQGIDFSMMETLVLDEADRMLDMGFIHDVKMLTSQMPQKRQTLLFSATFSKEIKALAERLLQVPLIVEVARANITAEAVHQVVHLVDRRRKRELLSQLIKIKQWKQVLVFTRTKQSANTLTKALQESGIDAAAIHGNKSQGARTKALEAFKSKRLPVLVATDIAARGIDIHQLPYVVNYELPMNPEDYVHRIGRTGRAGEEGNAISLVCIDEAGLLENIEKYIDEKIEKVDIPAFRPDPTIQAEPILTGRGKTEPKKKKPANEQPNRLLQSRYNKHNRNKKR